MNVFGSARMRIAGSVVIGATLLGGPWASAETVVDKTLAADPKGEVEIGNVAGSVNVVGWERDEVEVHGDLGDGVERLDFSREGPRTIVKVVLKRSTSSGGSDLTVRVPRESRLKTNTVSADQVVTGVRGALRLQSVSGEITTDASVGELNVTTVSGDISVRGDRNTPTRARIGTVSGQASLSRLAGELEFESVNGDAEISMSSLTRASLETTNGDLQLTGSLSRNAIVEAESVNGSISLNFENVANTAFVVESFNGDIENCFGKQTRRTREHGPGVELRFTEGEGLARVRVETLNGDVQLCKK